MSVEEKGLLPLETVRGFDGLMVVVEYGRGHDSRHHRVEGYKLFCGQRFFDSLLRTLDHLSSQAELKRPLILAGELINELAQAKLDAETVKHFTEDDMEAIHEATLTVKMGCELRDQVWNAINAVRKARE